MAKRVRPPMVSFAMFLIVCGMAWVGYQNRNVILSPSSQGSLGRDQRERIEEKIHQAFESDACYMGLRSGINWRPNEQRYRLDIEVQDGGCEDGARRLCSAMAGMIQTETGVAATVVAFDSAGREVGRCVL